MGRGWGRPIAVLTRGDPGRPTTGKSQRGSAVLLALALCLWVTAMVHALTMMVLCGRGALVDEARGRDYVQQSVEGLALMAKSLEQTWSAFDWRELDPVGLQGTEGLVSVLEGGEDWVVEARSVTRGEGPGIIVSAWVERGRDGLDLPRAGLVANSVQCDPGRTAPWLETSEARSEDELQPSWHAVTRAYLAATVSGELVGEGCAVEALGSVWGLGSGWRTTLKTDVGVCPGVNIVQCDVGETVVLERVCANPGGEGPVLVVVVGNGVLDARGVGEVHGVFVADGGSVLLDGTVLRGGLFATGDVDVGSNGVVIYDEAVCDWAKDRSLWRTRLVPGSRREGNE